MTTARDALARKGLHLAMGAGALLLRWLTPVQAAACAAAALLFNLFALHAITRGTLLREAERPRGRSAGILLYPLAILILILVLHRHLEIVAAAWGLLAFGDGMATLAGLALRGPALAWNPDKTWSGSLAFVLCGGGAAMFLMRWVRPDPEMHASIWIGGCIAAALAAALVETLRTGLDDNLSVPFVGAAVLYAATLVEPARLAAWWDHSGSFVAAALAFNLVVAAAALRARAVDRSGAIAGALLGTIVAAFGGWRCYVLLLGFFLLGTGATRAGYARKLAAGIAQEKGGRRGARHALANVSAGAAFAFLAVATPGEQVFLCAVAAAFATAAADTVSSEIGQAYGRRHVLVTSLRTVPAGTDGAVSLEGTAAGLSAAALLAFVGYSTGLLAPVGAGIVVVAALIGTTVESFLGATWERAHGIDNDVMNFTNTLVGGLTALALAAAQTR